MQVLTFGGSIKRVKPVRQHTVVELKRFVSILVSLFNLASVHEVVIKQKACDTGVFAFCVRRDSCSQFSVVIQHPDNSEWCFVVPFMQLHAALRDFLLLGDGAVSGVRCKYHGGPSSVVVRPVFRALWRTRVAFFSGPPVDVNVGVACVTTPAPAGPLVAPPHVLND